MAQDFLAADHILIPTQHYVPADHFLMSAHHFLIPANHFNCLCIYVVFC